MKLNSSSCGMKVIQWVNAGQNTGLRMTKCRSMTLGKLEQLKLDSSPQLWSLYLRVVWSRRGGGRERWGKGGGGDPRGDGIHSYCRLLQETTVANCAQRDMSWWSLLCFMRRTLRWGTDQGIRPGVYHQGAPAQPSPAWAKEETAAVYVMPAASGRLGTGDRWLRPPGHN